MGLIDRFGRAISLASFIALSSSSLKLCYDVFDIERKRDTYDKFEEAYGKDDSRVIERYNKLDNSADNAAKDLYFLLGSIVPAYIGTRILKRKKNNQEKRIRFRPNIENLKGEEKRIKFKSSFRDKSR